VALLLVYAAAVLLNLVLTGSTIYGPTHFDDEVRYWITARALHAGTFTISEFHHSPPVYPISLLPALFLFPANKAYQAAQVLNFIYITSIIFPVYFILRTFAGRGVSLLAAALVLLFPTQVVMPRSMISENLFYPLFLWVTCLAFRNFTSETSRWRLAENIIFGLLCGLLVLTRYIALAVVPAFFLFWWLKPLEGEQTPLLISKKKVLHAASVALPFLLILAVWVLLGLAQNIPLKELLGLGIADDPNPAQLGRRRFVMWAVFYLSYTAMIAAPYLGILAAAVAHIRWKEWRSPTNRWLIGAALICAFLLLACVRHSWRAAYNYPDPLKIQGRYILYFVPLFYIAAFAALRKMNLPRLSRSGYWLALIVVGELVSAAFFILYRGAIYLGGEPLPVSVNSSDGIFIRILDTRFLIGFFIILLLSLLFIGRRRTLLQGSLLALLVVFYVYGNFLMYKNFLKPSQYANYMGVALIEVLEARYGETPELLQTPVRLSLTDRIENSYCRAWESSMDFHGFTDVKCVRNGQSGEDDPTVFVAEVNGERFTLTNLGRDPVEVDGLAEFQYSGEYFVIQ